MENKIKNLLLEAIRYPRPKRIQEVCLPIWNQPFFYKIDKARALTISYNPTDKGARTNYPELLSRYAKHDFGNAEEIFELLYNFKKEIYWRKAYDLIFSILEIPCENISHMDVSFFPYKTFNDYLNNKDIDDSYKFLQQTISLLSNNLEYILIDGAKHKDIVKLFIKDYTLIDKTRLPINSSGKLYNLYIFKHRTLPTKLIYFECFLYGTTCPSQNCVVNLAKYIKTVINRKGQMPTNIKRCPKCKLNYILDGADLCSECSNILVKFPKVVNSPKRQWSAFFNEDFTFRNEATKYRGVHGYKAYNSKGENVGIVFMTDDKRSPSYEYCELCIYPAYQNHYGEWHKIKTNGGRIKWEWLCDYLKSHTYFKCHID